jgi:hypothetical protein
MVVAFSANDRKPTDNNQTAADEQFPAATVVAKIDAAAQCSSAKKPKSHLEKIETGLVVGAFIATAFAAFFTGKQWLVADRSMRVSNRAYVLSNSIRLITYGSHMWSITPIIENSGNTPTKLLRADAGVSIGAEIGFDTIEGHMMGLKFRDRPKSELVPLLIGPKAESYSVGGGTHSSRMTEMINHTAIGVMGVAKYQDVFGDHHLLEFCFMANVPQADYDGFPLGQPIRVPGLVCPHHNCSDEECGRDWDEYAKQ